jgi:ketol-acid reductoisomerase
VRDGYLTGLGFPCFVAIAQDGSGRAWDYLLALARAMGALKQGAIEVSFNQEVELDVFSQQVMLPAIHALLLTAFQTLTREGYPAEMVLTELYLSGELGTLLSRAAVSGLANTIENLSLTGQYNLLSRTERFQDAKTQRQMESILDQIRNGLFAQEWAAEYADGYPRLEALRRRFRASGLWRAEGEALEILRGLIALPPPDDDFFEE